MNVQTRLLGVALLLVNGAGPAGAQGLDRPVAMNSNVRSIAITATDRVLNQADIATVHIGYLLYGPDHDAAYATGATASQTIVKALQQAGVPAEAIESQEQSLAATDAEVLKALAAKDKVARAFTVRQSWTVRVAANDGTKVLDLSVHAGANDVGQIDWSLRDANAAQSAAAAKAIQRARSQAEAMAGGLHVRLGTLLYASNEVEAPPTPTVIPHPLMMKLLSAPPPPPPPMTINPQHIETSATVYAVFAIE